MRHLPGDKWLLLTLFVALTLDIWGVWWGLPNTASWSVDSSVPMTTLRGALCQFSDGWRGQHQPLQPALIALFCVPLFAYVYLTGGIDLSQVQRVYPWGLKDPEWLLSGVILTGRLLSVFSHLLLIWAMYRIGVRLRGRVAGIAAAILTALYYPFVYFAHVGNPDMLYIALMGVAVLWYIVFLEKPSAGALSRLSFFAALSTSVKFQALPFFAGMAPVVLWWLVAKQRAEGHAATRRVGRGMALSGLGVLVFVATFAVANNWMLNFQSSMQWFRAKKAGTEVSKVVRAERASLAETLYAADPLVRLSFAERTWYNIREGLSLPVLVLVVGGLVVCVVERRAAALALLLPFLAYAAFYAEVRAGYPRYLFPMVIPLLLLACAGVASAWNRAREQAPLRALCIVIAFLVVSWTFVRSAALCHLLQNGSRYQVERWFENRPQYRTSTVEVYQDLNKTPRLNGLACVTSFGADAYYRDKQKQKDVRRTAPRPAVPESVVSMPALLQRRPDFVVLMPAESPDNELSYRMQRHSGPYRLAAEFGGPTTLIKLTFGANPRLHIYQRGDNPIAGGR